MPIRRRRPREDKNPGNQSALCRIIEGALSEVLGSWLKFSLATLSAILIAVYFGVRHETSEPIPSVSIAPPVPSSSDPIASTPSFGESSDPIVLGRQLPTAPATIVQVQPDAYGKCLDEKFNTPYDFIYNYYHFCLDPALGEKRTLDGTSFDGSNDEPLLKKMYDKHLSRDFKNNKFPEFQNYSSEWIKYSSLSDDISITSIGEEQFRVSFYAHLLNDPSKKASFKACLRVSGEGGNYMIYPLTCPD